MPGFCDSLEELRELIEELRRAGVRSFEHPSGLKLTIDTHKAPEAYGVAPKEAGEF